MQTTEPTPTFYIDRIDRLDVIVGISDGFGDYITMKDMITEVGKVDVQPEQIFDNLVMKIKEEVNQVTGPNVSASGKAATKELNGINEGDSVSLFVLR
jgi:hypothetical protein